MSEIQPREILVRCGGRALQRGVLVGRSTTIARGGEEVVEVFSRADGSTPLARNVGNDAITRLVAQNRPRVEYVDLDGDGIRETPGWILEPQRLQSWDRSTEFNHANWSKTNCTISVDNQPAPDGGLADNIVESSDGAPTTHFVSRSLAGAADNTRQTFYFVVRAGVRHWGAIECLRKDNTTRFAYVNLDTGAVGTTSLSANDFVRVVGRLFSGISTPYWIISMTCDVLSGGTTPLGRFYTATADITASYQGNGSHAITIWHGQFELDKAYPTSPVVTTTATLTRAADQANLLVGMGRHLCTLYADVINRGQPLSSGIDRRFMALSQSGFVAPYFAIQGQNLTHRAILDTGAGLVSSGTLTAATFNERARMAAWLVDDGGGNVHVEFQMRLGNGAIASATPSSSTPLGSGAWSAQTLWINGGNGTGPSPDGLVLVDGMLIRAGHSLAECEAVPA